MTRNVCSMSPYMSPKVWQRLHSSPQSDLSFVSVAGEGELRVGMAHHPHVRPWSRRRLTQMC